MKKIIFLAGLPGVGKSTISKQIIQITKGLTIDLDDFKKEIVEQSTISSGIDPPEIRWIYYKKAIDAAVDILKTSSVSTIVLDEVFHVESLRNKLEEVCLKNNIKVCWIEVTCPYYLVQQRLNLYTRVGHILSTQETLDMYKLFENIFENFSSTKNYFSINNTGDVRYTARVLKSILKK